MFRDCDAIGGQVLSHREVRELHDLVATVVDDSDQSGTGRKYKFFWILGATTSIERGDRVHIRLDGKKLGKLLDTKWALGYDEALE
jgi:hypothetical protein